MRLTTQQIASIKQVAAEVFGGTAKIYLFGSRVLPSAEQWHLLRELRNQTAHEYPEKPELVLANLSHLALAKLALRLGRSARLTRRVA